MPAIFSICSLVLAGFSACLIAPFTVAVMGQSVKHIEGFGLLFVSYVFLSVVVILAFNRQASRLSRGGMFVLACCCWLTLVLAATIPFVLLERMSFLGAFYEASSAATALGTTFLVPETIATPMKAYRAIIAWFGGFLTLALIVYVLSPYRVGGLPNRDLRFVLHSTGYGGPKLFRTLAAIALPYIGLTFLCLLILLIQGVRPLDATLAATAAMSTNGFLPTQSGGSIFNNRAAEITMIGFMMVGGTSIIWHRMIFARRFELLWREHRESIGAIVLILGIGVLVALINGLTSDAPFAFLRHIFDVASTMTTTGVTHQTSQVSSVPLLLAFMLAMGGAATFSTSGGIKLYRLGIMLLNSLLQARQLVFPNAILSGRLEERFGSSGAIKAIWSFFFLFILTMCLGMLGFAILGMSFEDAFSSSVGSLSSVANLVTADAVRGEHGYLIGLWISAIALAGKLEILVILAAISDIRQR
ncbi:hypothetical protein [Maritalea porphyrae]|uniref:hypothetical protein n=1 Tax=Maritalea porphyrae TaxID=880732 RepID=UPI0022AE9EB9|nr:hypothetical protein [Maritalea porphyrae]MCZ4273085.1 hypothetical protein [Maritalea porphyrae]